MEEVSFLGIYLTEWVGYAASIAVAVSFLMKDIVKLRVINIVGCGLFVLYGFLMPTLRVGLPIIVTNAAIMTVNFYYLSKTLRSKAE
ncbi:MAG: uroporphyrinogen decarboxylase [Flavobacteriales bacterium]|nr:uroporphyrinogen decarboxylase [Flavobacteriales bacterium]MCB9197002.1 uroporphyrinogen decarboxylase [Flavobacteriales bacterium]